MVHSRTQLPFSPWNVGHERPLETKLLQQQRMLGNIICTVKMAGVVKKEMLRAGSGPTPQAGATITVHCTGSLNTNPPKKFWRYVFPNHYDRL